jgi:hypothetical protein
MILLFKKSNSSCDWYPDIAVDKKQILILSLVTNSPYGTKAEQRDPPAYAEVA